MAKVNIKDVAKRAGVSIATVSHVINGTRFVREETQQKVLDAIDALNYHPNAVARGLVTKSTQTIGLVISDVTNPFFTAVVRGVEDVINQHRYNTILCNTDEDPNRENTYLRLLTTQQIDGLIIAPTGIHHDLLAQMTESGIPIVLIDRKCPGFVAPWIGVENEHGSYQATRYLLKLGHRRIAFIMTLNSISTQQERLAGFKRALLEANVPIDENLIVNADPLFYGTIPQYPGSILRPAPDPQHIPSAYQALQKILSPPNRPTAIFVANNQLVLGTLYAFREHHLRCPKDISIISFDDHDWAPIFTPPLTVVRQPTYRLGQSAAKLLMRMINGETVETPPPFIPEFIVRGSCQAPSNFPNGENPATASDM